MKESLRNYLKKNKNKPVFVALRIILKILVYPFSNLYLIKTQETLLRYALMLKLFREFWLSKEAPHFSDLRASYFLSYKNKFPPWLNRGFYSRQVINNGDTVLDIGCGNGFFDYFFYSGLASRIDAVDIEEDAIKRAKKQHSDKNINYYKIDVTKEELPSNNYDVIMMDGSIGHFNEKDMDIVMNKILSCMNENSLFVGSEAMESIENKSYDHFQVFPTEKDMEMFLLRYFKKVKIWSEDEIVYKQVYFRCANTDNAFKKLEKTLRLDG